MGGSLDVFIGVMEPETPLCSCLSQSTECRIFLINSAL